MAGLQRPQNKHLVNPQTGRLDLEWDAYFARIEQLLNTTLSGGVVSFEGRTGIVVGVAGDYTATEITNAPAGNIAATTVQAALNELDAEKAAASHTHDAGDIVSGTFDDARIAESNVTQHEAAINHDALSGFVANEHIDHSAVSVTAGDGLTGGGTIAANRTLNVGAGTGISVTADAVALDTANDRNVDHSAVSITAGNGLTGGGTIAASRTLDVGAGTGITVAADTVGITPGGVGTTQLADEGVTNAKLAHAAAWTLKMRNAATTGDPSDAALADVSDGGTPAAGDFVLGFLDSGEIRKFDIDNLPGGGGGGNVGQLIAIIEDQKTQNTQGGTFTNGADRIRTLNTLVFNRDTTVSLSSNQFTLPAGDWEIEWSAPAMNTQQHQSFLYNVTGAAVVQRGDSARSEPGSSERSHGIARVSIGSSTAYEIRHRCNTSEPTIGFGAAANFGTEVYTRVVIRSS